MRGFLLFIYEMTVNSPFQEENRHGCHPKEDKYPFPRTASVMRAYISPDWLSLPSSLAGSKFGMHLNV